MSSEQLVSVSDVLVISRFQQQNVCQMLTTQHSSFLYTVSRLVSSRDIRRRGSEEEGGRLLHVTDPDPTIKPKSYPKPPVMQTLFYIHVIALFIILTFCWLDTLPGIGRVSGIKRDVSSTVIDDKSIFGEFFSAQEL